MDPSTGADSESIRARLTELFREIVGQRDVELFDHTTAADVDGWDSLAHIEFIMKVEKEFGVRFALGELQDMKNVGELIRAVQKKS